MSNPAFRQEEMSSEPQYAVLFLDDEANILRSVKRLFAGRNHKLVIVDNGQKALDYMQDNSVQVVISDVRMPGMPGDVFLEKVAEKFPDTHRIVLSGYADSDIILRLVNNGRIHRYIQKPWQNEALIEAVEEGVNKFRLKQEYQNLQHQLSIQNKRLKTLNSTLEERVELRTLQLKTSLKQANQGIHGIKKVLLNTFDNVSFIDPARGRQVSSLAEKVATELKLDVRQISNVSFAALIHELGMLPLGEVIYKQPLSSMSQRSKELYFNQAKNAKSILSSSNQILEIREIVLKQFEYINSKGFPDNLSADEIPLTAHILAISRDFYRYSSGLFDGQKYNATLTLNKLHRYVGVQFSEQVYNALATVISGEKTLSNTKNNCVSATELRVGMILKEGVYNRSDILILPEGHVMDEKSIAKLVQLEQDTQVEFDIFVE